MNPIETNVPEQQSEESAAVRKPYATPTMTDFGSVAELTRGILGGAGFDYNIGS